jgi:hypothetical protein
MQTRTTAGTSPIGAGLRGAGTHAPRRIFLLFSADSFHIVLNRPAIYASLTLEDTAVHVTTENGRSIMESTLKWETDIKTALSLAEKNKKPILLDFFNPG